MPRARKEKPDDLLSSGDVAKLLNVNPSRVRQLALDGYLVEAMRLGGKRVFRRSDVEAFSRTRTKGKIR